MNDLSAGGCERGQRRFEAVTSLTLPAPGVGAGRPISHARCRSRPGGPASGQPTGPRPAERRPTIPARTVNAIALGERVGVRADQTSTTASAWVGCRSVLRLPSPKVSGSRNSLLEPTGDERSITPGKGRLCTCEHLPLTAAPKCPESGCGCPFCDGYGPPRRRQAIPARRRIASQSASALGPLREARGCRPAPFHHSRSRICQGPRVNDASPSCSTWRC